MASTQGSIGTLFTLLLGTLGNDYVANEWNGAVFCPFWNAGLHRNNHIGNTVVRHQTKLQHENYFHIHYWIIVDNFDKLVDLLQGSIELNWPQATKRNICPIISKIIDVTVIQYFSEGTYNDIHSVYGFSLSTFYYIWDKFLTAFLLN